MVKLKKLCSEHLLSYRFQCVNYDYSLPPSKFCRHKNRMWSDMAKYESPISCLLIRYQPKSANKAPKWLGWQQLHCLAVKWHNFCRNLTGLQNVVSESVLYIGVNIGFLNMGSIWRVAHITHHAPNLIWDFLHTITYNFECSGISEIKLRFIAKWNVCGFDFSSVKSIRAPVHKT
jgi:hypothetical protein